MDVFPLLVIPVAHAVGDCEITEVVLGLHRRIDIFARGRSEVPHQRCAFRYPHLSLVAGVLHVPFLEAVETLARDREVGRTGLPAGTPEALPTRPPGERPRGDGAENERETRM